MLTPPRDGDDTQEHCDHECVCAIFVNEKKTIEKVPCVDEPDCIYDTRKEEPTREDLITFARWTQKFWREGQEIQRKHGIVIDNLDDPMQKLAFTYYSNLSEIDLCVSHLFREGYGDENYGKEHEIYTPEHGTNECPNCIGCGSEKESSCDEPCPAWLDWHDAQVCAKERERVLSDLQTKANQRQTDAETEDGNVIEVIEKGEVLAWIDAMRQREQGK